MRRNTIKAVRHQARESASWKTCCVLCILLFNSNTYAIDADVYGSLRLQAEYVNPDNQPNSFDRYVDLRDAYSRIGIKIEQTLAKQWSALFQFEVPLDLANLDIQGTWDQDEDIRILKLLLASPFGTLSYGRDWLPYYNQIAYPVDYFSSYYSGFATFTTFRLDDILYYTSPSFNGFQVSLSTSKDNGSTSDDRNQLTAFYSKNKYYLALGIDDLSGQNDVRILGASASYTNAPWYFAAKYERFASDIGGDGWAADGTDVVNALVQYSIGKHSLRLMLADVDNYGEFVFHTGWDYRLKKNIKFFFEYYQEQETAAISDARQTTSFGNNSNPADSGGKGLVTGFRYDF